jgi:hypothetical protein
VPSGLLLSLARRPAFPIYVTARVRAGMGRVVEVQTMVVTRKKTPKTGGRVTWSAGSEGTVAGAVNPEYLVESDKTGAVAAHKPSALNPARKKTSERKRKR